MKTVPKSLLNFLGIRIQGDLADITCYRSKRGGVIWFLKAPPKCPPSELQNQLREKWRAILDDWLALPEETKANWELITQAASLCLHGLNLYIWWRCSQDDAIIHTLERHTGIDVL